MTLERLQQVGNVRSQLALLRNELERIQDAECSYMRSTEKGSPERRKAETRIEFMQDALEAMDAAVSDLEVIIQ